MGVVGLVALGGVALVGAQSAPPGATGTAGSGGGWAIQPESAPARNPFELAPSDVGAIPYADLATTPIPQVRIDHPDDPIPLETYRAISRESRASVEDADMWAQTDNGPAVATAWSAYTTLMVADAARQRAEREAGLTGAGDVGVE